MTDAVEAGGETATEATSEVVMTPAQFRTAMKDPSHLKRWLRETNRTFIVFDAIDLVDSLAWPTGIQAFQAIVDAYRAHRREIPVETAPCPTCSLRPTDMMGIMSICDTCSDSRVVTLRAKTDLLEPDEIDRAIEHLQNLKAEAEAK